jgi:UDP-GlcNAc:undecaprenyl-phosphate GlcNAc-1-phosphate transferase
MIPYFYLSIFLAALAISLLLTPWVCEMANAIGLVTPPSSRRHLHTAALPRLGGAAICIAFMVALGLSLPLARLSHVNIPVHLLIGMLLPALLIFLLGIFDDVRSLSAKTKLAVQSIAGAALSFSGLGVRIFTNLLGGHFLARTLNLGLTVFWVLLVTNAFNLIDGLDGLAAGSALVSAIVIFVIAVYLHNVMVAVLVTALAGAILGFLPSNFYPADIFMGDSGSLLIGFLLSAAALAVPNTRTPIAAVIPLLVCGLPILDVTLAIARRTLRGQSPFHPDAQHVHHKLLKRGLPQDRVALTLYAVTGLFGLAGIILVWHDAWALPVLVALAIVACLGVRQLQYPEFSRLFSPWLPQLWPDTPVASGKSDKIRILNATQFLNSTGDFRAIFVILQEALTPMGFDGLRLDMDDIHFGGSLPAPFIYDQQGRLVCFWTQWAADVPHGETPRSEAEIASIPGFGLLYLISTATPGDASREMAKVPSEDFRIALSDAFLRAVNRNRRSRHPATDSLSVGRVAEEVSSD